MKRVKKTIITIALALTCVGVGTIYALTVENSNPTEGVRVRRQCPRCDGKGKVEVRETHAPCHGQGCAACDYNGYVTYQEICPNCEGSGWVWVGK